MKGFSRVLVIGLIAAGLSACSNHGVVPFNPNKERKYFGVAVSQLPPEPVYNRLMTSYLPQPLPSRDTRKASFTRLNPVFQFEMKDATLEETARVLAGTARYTSYCSSVIASRKINLVTVGNIDEIGKYVGDKAGINVVVDHSNREIRFLANGTSSYPNRTPAITRKNVANEKVVKETAGALPVNVRVSEKTNGFLNNIKIEG